MKKPKKQKWNEICDQAITKLLGLHDPIYEKITAKAIYKTLTKRKRNSAERLLIGARDALKTVPCTFWACKGFEKRPESMVTCDVCRVVWKINQYFKKRI